MCVPFLSCEITIFHVLFRYLRLKILSEWIIAVSRQVSYMYHGENKLCFDEMDTMMSVLHYNTRSRISHSKACRYTGTNYHDSELTILRSYSLLLRVQPGSNIHMQWGFSLTLTITQTSNSRLFKKYAAHFISFTLWYCLLNRNYLPFSQNYITCSEITKYSSLPTFIFR